MKMFFGRLPVVQGGNCSSPWICEPSWEHWELFPEPLLQPFTTLLFSWHSPASPPLLLSTSLLVQECIALCLVGISILYFVAAIWEGASCSPASKLTQGVGFHRQHVLGHKAWTPDRVL